MTDWIFNGKPFTEVPKGAHGFVYIITETSTGKRYLGKKSFWSVRKLKPTDKRRTRVESDWKKYWSSSAHIKKEIKENGNSGFKREIIAICNLERHMNYLEVKYQFAYNILEEGDKWLNENINGCWYPHLYNDVNDHTTFGKLPKK